MAEGGNASEPLTRSLADLLRLMRSREVSPVEVVQRFLDRIQSVNGALNAVVTLRSAAALDEALQIERTLARGTGGRLAGIPFTVKDTIETQGVRTTAGSRLRAEVVPRRDAPAVARLRSEGAILLGKTNTPEFAMTYSTDNSIFGRTLNPWNLNLTPGGSSGGEGAVIAAGGSPLGLGSDLGGSIRVPANFCGISGLRPSIGRVPATGHVPMLPLPLGGMSVIGPMSRSVEDLCSVMAVLATNWRDSGQAPSRIAYYADDGVVPVDPEVRQTLESVAGEVSRHLAVERVIPPRVAELYGLWDEVWEASGGARGLLGAYLDGGGELSPTLARLVDSSPAGRDDSRLSAAMARLGVLRGEVLRFMAEFPVVLCPVAAGMPTSRAGRWDFGGTELRGARGFGYSYIWTLLGFPAIAVPWERRGPAGDIPTGVQIVAGPGQDELALEVAMHVEEASNGVRSLAPCGA